ncbi:GNAT family N-acetyltransferase [Thermodesulfobacteriota bacterium]
MVTKCDYSELTIPSDRSYASVASMYIGEVAKKMGFSTEEIQPMLTGLEEAISCTMDYSFAPEEMGTLEISCERTPAGLKVVVKDKGLPIGSNPDSWSHTDGESGQTACLPHAVYELGKLVDHLSIDNLGRDGKQMVVIKNLKHKRITDYYDTCELEPYKGMADKPEILPRKIHFSVRPMEPSDAIEVVKCIYRTFGYTYEFADVYFPERLVEFNKNGQMYSVVGLTEAGEIAGHCSLKFPEENARIAELAMATVKPRFRHRGLLTKLTNFTVEKAKLLGLEGLYAEAVTLHTYSQRVLRRIGFDDGAVALGCFPGTSSYKGIAEEQSQRETAVWSFRNLSEHDPVTIYPPSSHSAMIAKLYDHLGISVNIPECAKDDHGTASGESEITAKVVDELGIVTIRIGTYGESIALEVRSMVKVLCLKRLDVIRLYLNLCDPLTARMTDEFEQLGFFFAGILPYSFSDGDALVLQYLNNIALNYDGIKIDSDMGNELLEYIKRRDPNRI